MYGRCQEQYIGGKLRINTNLKLSKLISNGEKKKNSTVRKEIGVIIMKHLGIFVVLRLYRANTRKTKINTHTHTHTQDGEQMYMQLLN